MEPLNYNVFISYSRRDHGVAQAFRKCVQLMGGVAFVAETDMEGGREVRDELIERIRSADEMLLLVSDPFLQSKWTGWELGVVEGLNKVDGKDRKLTALFCSVERATVEGDTMWNAHLARLTPVEMHYISVFLDQLRDRIKTKVGHTGDADDLTAWIVDELKELRTLMVHKLTAFETSFKARHRGFK
jgi:TIR domain